MLTITRSLARSLKSVFRRAVPGRSHSPAVLFAADTAGLSIRIASPEIALEYRQPGKLSPESFALPFECLAACEGTRDDPVTLELNREGRVVLKWTDKCLPQSAAFEDCEESLQLQFPALPESFSAADPGLLAALHEAVQTAAEDHIRYALDTIQLRGASGEIVATDGGQLLLQGGFQFPFEEDLRIPRTQVFRSPELIREQTVEIGRTETHLVLRIGPWTLCLLLQQEGRFPDVQTVIPAAGAACARMILSDADRSFLADALRRMLGAADDHSPVTLELNGHVAIRAKGEQDEQATELILSGSRAEGEPIRVNTNRTYLQRAARLGFETVELTGADKPFVCRDEHKTYVWMALGGDGTLSPGPDCVRIESDPGASSTTNPTQTNSRSSRMTRRKSNGRSADRQQTDQEAEQPPVRSNGSRNDSSNGTDTGSTSEPPIGDPLTEAESLRETLRSAMNANRRLISALKRQKKQSRLVQSTLASLRQLNTLEFQEG